MVCRSITENALLSIALCLFSYPSIFNEPSGEEGLSEGRHVSELVAPSKTQTTEEHICCSNLLNFIISHFKPQWRSKLNGGNLTFCTVSATRVLLAITHQRDEKHWTGHEATLVWEFTTAFVPLTRFFLSAWSFQKFPWMSAPIQVSLVGFWWVVSDGPPDKPPCQIPFEISA